MHILLERETYKKPTQNMERIWSFFRRDMDSLASSGSGSIKTARSKMRFIPAAIYIFLD